MEPLTPPDAPRGSAADHRVAVALTFDFDAESGWIGTHGIDTPSALSRGAYGVREGIPRILDLLGEYQLPGTFFVPGDTARRHPESVQSIVAAGHEIGHHGFVHETPFGLPLAEEREMLVRGFEALDRWAGRRPIGYRAPMWELSPNTLALLEEFGLEYDASQLGADRPYRALDGLRPTAVVEIPSAWELNDLALFKFAYKPYMTGLKSPSDVLEIWQGDFDGMYAENSDATFVLSLHPEIIGRHHRMTMLRDFLDHALALPGVWFARMDEIGELYNARERA